MSSKVWMKESHSQTLNPLLSPHIPSRHPTFSQLWVRVRAEWRITNLPSILYTQYLSGLKPFKDNTVSWCLIRDYSPSEWAALLISDRRFEELPYWADMAAPSNCCHRVSNAFQSTRMRTNVLLQSELFHHELDFQVQDLNLSQHPQGRCSAVCYYPGSTSIFSRNPPTLQGHSVSHRSFRQSSTDWLIHQLL